VFIFFIMNLYLFKEGQKLGKATSG